MSSVRGEMARFPDMNPGPVACVDRSGRIAMANRAARNLFRDDLQGKCLWDLIPDVELALRDRALEGETVRTEVKVGDVWLQVTIAPDPDGDELFVYGTDISRQKAAEQDVRERARFPELNPGPVARLHRDGSVIRANPAAHRIFGVEDMRGHCWHELCPGLGSDGWKDFLVRGSAQAHEERVGGRWYAFTLRLAAELDQVFVYGTDVTEMKAAEEALAELARFPELNPGPVCRLDTKGRILLANPAALEVFGNTDLVGHSWLELCPKVDRAFWERVLATEEPIPIEVEIGRRHYVMTHAPGGQGHFVFVYGSDITVEKQSEAALRQSQRMMAMGTLSAGLAHELNNPASASRRASGELRPAFDQLQRIEVAIGSGDFSKEFNTIREVLLREAYERRHGLMDLDSMTRSDLETEVEDWLTELQVEDPWKLASYLVDLGFDVQRLESLSSRVEDEAARPLVEWLACLARVYQLIDEIGHGTSRVSELVNSMKAYTHLGQAPVQMVNVNEGLRNTLVVLRSKLKDNVNLVLELDPSVPMIEASGSELNQVWTNLVDNAVHAMSDQGTLIIRTGVEGDRVVVEVEDDGHGIPQDLQDRVFDAFFTTKPPGSGAGLGLHTTYNIVTQRHGGSIELESEPGRTRFVVRLPT